MTDKLKCPFCEAELVDEGAKIGNEGRYFACENLDCDLCGEPFSLKIWQALIDGKKAQRQLRTAKDQCIKKIKAKEREIANYLNGISVRDKEIQNLREQLQKAQDALLFISNIRGVGMSYQDMFLDAQAVAKYASGRTSDLILVGRYAQDELNGITKQEK